MIFRQFTDPVAAGLCMPLRQYVRDMRRLAEEADWAGDADKARIFEHEADLAIKRGEDPVCLF